jgi:putative tricarboxylic transport membrane protein
MFGGGISAILINIPGDSHAVMTAIDGYAMAKKGQAAKALFCSFMSSFFGGMVGAILITLCGTLLARVGLLFGPPEMAAIILVAMTSIGWILGESPTKGLMAIGLGLLFACVGMDPIFSKPRFVFNQITLVGGIPFIPFVIGLFGFSSVIKMLADGLFAKEKITQTKLRYRDSIPSKKEFSHMIPVQARTSVIGFFIGMLPGSGATTSAFLSYIFEKRINKRRKLMGTGIPEGIAASETADNAASVGAFGPMFALGIPGSSTTAVLLSGLLMWGLKPGPMFMSTNSELAWSVIASMFIGNLIVALLCFFAIPFFASLLKVPKPILVPIMVCLTLLGAYSVNNNVLDLYIMVIGGLVGYVLSEADIPLAPLVLCTLLGTTLEQSFRQALVMSSGNWSVFVTRNLSLGILIFGVLFITLPILAKVIQKRCRRSTVQ